MLLPSTPHLIFIADGNQGTCVGNQRKKTTKNHAEARNIAGKMNALALAMPEICPCLAVFANTHADPERPGPERLTGTQVV